MRPQSSQVFFQSLSWSDGEATPTTSPVLNVPRDLDNCSDSEEEACAEERAGLRKREDLEVDGMLPQCVRAFSLQLCISVCALCSTLSPGDASLKRACTTLQYGRKSYLRLCDMVVLSLF